MLRFRNRFKGAPSDLHRCGCGRVVTTSYSHAEARGTIIHELPWCDQFRQKMAELQASNPTTQMHQAAMLVETRPGGSVDTVVVADGDRLDDVSEPVAATAKGGAC